MFIVSVRIVLVVAAVYVVGPSFRASYDAERKVRISCIVERASGGAASARLHEGAGSSVSHVVSRPRTVEHSSSRRESIAAVVRSLRLTENPISSRGLVGVVGASRSMFDSHHG